MKKSAWIMILAGLLLVTPAGPAVRAASWSGVDETVIEKFAQKAGRTPSEPIINTQQGDLLLFVFLIAGIVGGFIGGYNFRTLFRPKRSKAEEADGVAKGKFPPPLPGGD